MGSSFVDRDHVVELAALDAGTDVALVVARALDVVMDSGRPDDAVRSIARLHALLVLDNCEHVADDVATFLGRILSASEPNLRILATSQVRLGLSGEQVVAIGALAVPAAIALFVERVRAVLPEWTPDAVGDARLEHLVSRLDRLPLTIEMAAARLSSMSFDDLEATIADGTSLLRLSHRTPAARHRSLESVVAWSTDLLDADQRRMFRDFSVFAGRVDVADAAAVVAPDDPTGARFDLASLAERSLLVADVDGAGSRYDMLTTMRAVAERWLEESGDADAMRRRHAEHIRDVLRDVDDQLRTPAEPEGRRRLALLIDEARAAFHWAGSHDLGLVSDLGAALHLATYPTIWLEPAEWCRDLSSRPATDLCGVALLSAGAAIHRGELDAARQMASDVAGVSTGRLRAIAEELLGEVALYVADAEQALRRGPRAAPAGRRTRRCARPRVCRCRLGARPYDLW